MRTEILDKGYLEIIEIWGSDKIIIETARMSTDKGFLGWLPVRECSECGCQWRNNGDGTMSLNSMNDESCSICESFRWDNLTPLHDGDEKLLAYLWKNCHSTPFEFAGMTIEVKAPIMVFREWHRHRTQSYSEVSARYVPLPDDNYIPTIERCMTGSNSMTTNRQAQSANGVALTVENSIVWLEALQQSYEAVQKTYELGLEIGIPKELARLPLPVGRYSRMRVTANLRNWLAFLALREDIKAQYEIRVYANEVCRLIAQNFSRTHKVFKG
jgi:thymidylate synthase (FAD)